MKISKGYLLMAGLGLLLVLVLSGYLYLNQSHRNIQDEEARFTLTAFELEERFRTSTAQTELVDQVVQVKGRITALHERSMTIEQKVDVGFTKKLPTDISKGTEVIVKGRCVGYDDLLALVKIDQAMVIK